ncbi:hypothetical protein AB0H83_08605 [Dactylosporangium sp. NPDC050688]|uniref:hypothetical protein n=1 Tax=Dactylosporangium sp. NPDC050688 TaxID=3157217 RepID=UPI0033F9EC38
MPRLDSRPGLPRRAGRPAGHAARPHTLAFLATVNNVPVITLGVSRFGQSGALEEVYRHHGIDTDAVVGAALDLAG